MFMCVYKPSTFHLTKFEDGKMSKNLTFSFLAFFGWIINNFYLQ